MNGKLEKYKTVFQCNGCGSGYETRQEAEACFEKDTLNIPTFIEERIESIGEIFPTEIILKRLEKGFIVEVAEYERKNINRVNKKYE